MGLVQHMGCSTVAGIESHQRTQILKVKKQACFSDIQEASASVWNECLHLMDMYQWNVATSNKRNHRPLEW